MNKIGVILLSTAMLSMALMPYNTQARSKSRSSKVIVINGASYTMHMVEKGDTLYSLSKLYDTDEAKILAANPTLNGVIRAGSEIKIPLKNLQNEEQVDFNEVVIDRSNQSIDAADSSDDEQIDDEQRYQKVIGYRNSEGSVAPAGLKYYSVEKSDNLESIAVRHEMSLRQLKRVNNNPQRDSLYEGAILLVRDEESSKATAPYTQEVEQKIEKRVESVVFTPIAESDTLNIAMMLPLSVGGRTMKPFVEFYQGALLAIEELKRSGRNVVLNLYNTERDAMRVREIIADPSYEMCQLIIGPVYEELLSAVLHDAEMRSIPVVSPLATLSSSDSPVLFQMAPDTKYRYDKMDDLLDESRSVTLIEGESNDKTFHEEVMRLLAIRDVGYRVHRYEYEHPSIIDEREKAAEKAIKAAQDAAEEAGEILDEAVIDSLSAEMSLSDLTPLLMGEEVKTDKLIRDGVLTSQYVEDSLYVQRIMKEMDEKIASVKGDSAESQSQKDVTNGIEEEAGEEIDLRDIPIYHTLFILSNNEVEVDRILSALSSAYAAQIATNRGSGRNIRELIKYEVVANPEWRRYKNIDRAIYFRNYVTLFSSYLAGRDAENIRHFDGRYAEEFSELPSLYAYRGFDVVMIFGEGLYKDIEFNMSVRTYQALQSSYRFERDEESSTIINTNWMREDYKPNFTKEIY